MINRKINKFQAGTLNGGILPETIVYGIDRRPAWQRMYYNPNLGTTSYNGDALEDVVSFVPGISDAVDGVKAADALNQGNYLQAGVLGAGLLVPNILEGPLKYGMRKLYPAATRLLKNASDEGFLNFVERLSNGQVHPRFTNNEPVKYVDVSSETVPKGFVQGNEFTPDMRYPAAEEGLTRRKNPVRKETVPPIKTEAEAQAAKDYLEENGYLFNPDGNPIKLDPYTGQPVKIVGRPKGSKNKPKEVIAQEQPTTVTVESASPKEVIAQESAVPKEVIVQEQPATITIESAAPQEPVIPQQIETSYSQSGTQSERIRESKVHNISRSKHHRVNNADKNARAMEDGDARHVYSGRNRHTEGARRDSDQELRELYNSGKKNYYTKEHHKLDLKRAKGKDVSKEMKKLLDEYLDFKKNGFKKLLGGVFRAKSGIKINPANKGKFTDYCGGKVTSECIAKGKKSSNPVIRKRATFADNARHFKHQFGGEIIINQSPIAERNRYWLFNNYAEQQKKLREQEKALEQAKIQKQVDVVGSILGTAAQVGQYFLNSPNNNSTVKTPNYTNNSFWSNPTTLYNNTNNFWEAPSLAGTYTSYLNNPSDFWNIQ